jgi:hypothetical protein
MSRIVDPEARNQHRKGRACVDAVAIWRCSDSLNFERQFAINACQPIVQLDLRKSKAGFARDSRADFRKLAPLQRL